MKKQPFRRFERSIPLGNEGRSSNLVAGVQGSARGPLVLQHYAQFTGRRL